ncbi:histidinol-phosphate transaminase [Vallitaleaceae bacterium 9-2]
MKELNNFHGSDVEKVAKFYHLDEKSIINFSGNVNPLGLSEQLQEKLIANIDLVTNYPDPDYHTLKASISQYASTQSEYVLLGNGTTELIAHYIDYVHPKKALIIGPTYSEYEKKISSCDAGVVYYPLSESNDFKIDIETIITMCTTDIDLVVLCNPNNPTASLITSKELTPLFDHLKALGLHILIDETYMDFIANADHISAINLVERYSNCIVLRSFSKFFSAPGLRLGYGITSDFKCHESMEKQRHHWAINSLAAFAGSELMKDSAFIEHTHQFIESERIRVGTLLSTISALKVFPNYGNFFFVKIIHPQYTTQKLFDHLIKRHLMIRNTASFPFLHGEYFRFSLSTRANNDLLIDALQDFFTQ